MLFYSVNFQTLLHYTYYSNFWVPKDVFWRSITNELKVVKQLTNINDCRTS